MNFLNPKTLLSEIAVLSGSVVADFGFGSAHFLEEISKQVGFDGVLYAIDIQPDIVKKASDYFFERGISNTNFINADLEKPKSTKLGDASVDLVIISSMLFQAENKEAVINEAFRILKQNGRLFISDWKESFAGLGPSKDMIFSQKEAVSLLADYSVILEREVKAGGYHYALVFRKK